jgi:iron complex outermembrane recepter protein
VKGPKQLESSIPDASCPAALRNALWNSMLCLGLLSALCASGWASATEAVSDATAAAAAANNEEAGLAEITVTAEKYNSTIQNTSISMSALTGDQLTAQGIDTVEDASHEVPGLSMRTAGPGVTEYEARGLASNGGAAPTVGFYLDEVPLSPDPRVPCTARAPWAAPSRW